MNFITNDKLIVFPIFKTSLAVALPNKLYYNALRTKINVGLISFVSTIGLSSIIRLKIRLLTFAEFVEFLKSSKVMAGLSVFWYLPA